ncbi:MAG: class I SAM-dependent methyltransferase [Anaerolineae bacterium]|nr:class I SAM-dependent methyltransferase [Anaerolineae bacterium]
MTSLTERQRADAAFFDQHWAKLAQEDFDWIVPPDEEMFLRDLGRSLRYVLERMGDIKGLRILELGCGTGDYTVVLARRGASVWAADLAPSALEITRRRALMNSVDDCIHPVQMSAETLALPDDTFDWVVGFGLLHHAEPPNLAAEVQRVLRASGRALFREPLGLNPFLEFARRYIPYRRKVRAPGDRFLREEDLKAVAACFPNCRIRSFYLFSMITRAVGREDSFPLLWALDEFLLRRFSSLWRWCRYAVLECQA